MAGKATGERIRGSVYRLICQLAIDGATTNQIAVAAKVSHGTAAAIITRESQTIGERKKAHADACLRVAHQALERLEDNLHRIAPGSLATITGILTDKASALTSSPEGNTNLHIHLQSIDVISDFNRMLHSLPSNAAEMTARLPEMRQAQEKQPEPKQIEATVLSSTD